MTSTHTQDDKLRLERTNRAVVMERVFRSSIISEEFFNFICGPLIGWGAHRDVFEYKPEPKFVIKIDTGDRNANVLEDEIWHYVEHTSMNKWFAPVKSLSPCGRILLQRRCITQVTHDQYPKKVPEFFTDLKYANWGKLDGRLVCLDYANSLVMNTGLFSRKMKKADWWHG